MKYLLGIFFVLMISQVCAVCESEQIDINSDSLTRLDELGGIGPVKAQAIIDTRPFDSVEDLIDVYGIGEVTLQKIKEQGLACIEGEKDEPEDIPSDENNDKINEDLTPKGVPPDPTGMAPDTTGMTNGDVGLDGSIIPDGIFGDKENKPEIITLNSQTKDIKTDDPKKKLDKSDWATYGFIGFCVLLGFLFILKKRKVCSEFD